MASFIKQYVFNWIVGLDLGVERTCTTQNQRQCSNIRNTHSSGKQTQKIQYVQLHIRQNITPLVKKVFSQGSDMYPP